MVTVSDEDAMETSRQLAKLEGFMCGISCGAAAWAALHLAKQPENAGKLIVCDPARPGRTLPVDEAVPGIENWGVAVARRAMLTCSALLFVPQLRQHAVIFQRRRVADGGFAAGDVAQQPPHDLAAARLGQRSGEADVVGLGQRADFLANVLLRSSLRSFSSGLPLLSVTNTATASPLISSGRPTAAASATCGWLTRALSISIVLRRCPATFSTSSMRPMIQ